MSQTTVGRIIKSISKRIALLLPHFIRFPGNNELSEVKSKFYEIARFPTVIGTIDCTHVRIKCPAKNVGPEMAGHFLNRKGFYSLNVQVGILVFSLIYICSYIIKFTACRLCVMPIAKLWIL